MSLLHRLAKTLRPSSSNPTGALRSRPTPQNFMPPDYFSSMHRVGLGPIPRFSSHKSYQHDANININIVYGLIGVNAGIFLYAQYLKAQAQQGFGKPLVTFMQNMTLNLDAVTKEGRWWTLITSVFTHLSPMHILGNGLSMYYLGGMVARTPGMTPIRLLSLVFGSGLAGSVGHLCLRYQQTAAKGQRDYVRGLGFSGAVMGLGTVAAFLYPRTTMLIYGIVPVPLWGLMAGYALFDGYYLNEQNARIGHAGHLGGLAFGAFYFLARMRGIPFSR